MNPEDIIAIVPGSPAWAEMKAAVEEQREFRVTLDGGIKTKVGGGMWSLPQTKGV